MKRIRIHNSTHLVEWEDTPEAMKEAKMFRRMRASFRYKRIKHILQLLPDQTPLRRILEIGTGKDSVNNR
jgi:hypothetical protein